MNKNKKSHLGRKFIEDKINLRTMLSFRTEEGENIGGYLLEVGKKRSVRFGFYVHGIHCVQSESEAHQLILRLTTLLREMPHGEFIKIEFSTFQNSVDSDRYFDRQIAANDGKPQIQFLLISEKLRRRELAKAGIRQRVDIKIYVSYGEAVHEETTKDVIDIAQSKISTSLSKALGSYEEEQQIELSDYLSDAYQSWFQIDQLIGSKAGLGITPMTDQDMWDAIAYEFSDRPLPIPQVLIWDGHNLQEIVHSPLETASYLFPDDLPICSRDWIAITKDRQVVEDQLIENTQYVGALTFIKKPGGWESASDQLFYAWSILSHDQITDTKLVFECTHANQRIIEDATRRTKKQSIVAMDDASKRHDHDTKSEGRAEESIQLERQLNAGDIPVRVGLSFLVYANTTERLKKRITYLKNRITAPAKLIREDNAAWSIFFQSLPTWKKPLNQMDWGCDLRDTYLASEAVGFMPLVKPRSEDREGLEFLSAQGGIAMYLDLFRRHRNLMVLATTRGGKSVLISSILTLALAENIPIVAVDYPKTDGTSTFTDYSAYLGELSAYFNIAKERNNLFEFPDTTGLSEFKKDVSIDAYKDFLIDALMAMVFSTSDIDPLLKQTVQTIITLALVNFLEDPAIQKRYEEAYEFGFGSIQWHDIPTLQDFIPYCTDARIVDEAKTSNSEDSKSSYLIESAISQIRIRLNYWLSNRAGKAISQPSTIKTDAPLIVFALTRARDEEASIFALSAYAAALRRALRHPKSIFFIDESPILFKFTEIANIVGSLCANGAKSGIRVILSAQDPDTIAKSSAGAQIFQNMQTRLIGRIQPSAIKSFVQFMDYPKEIIAPNASEKFFPDQRGFYSSWLVDDSGVQTPARFYPGIIPLAAVVNNPEEQITRDHFMANSPDKYTGLSAFSNYLVRCIKNDIPISPPTQPNPTEDGDRDHHSDPILPAGAQWPS